MVHTVPEMVRRVADALADESIMVRQGDFFEHMARQAIKAMREPTEDMLIAGRRDITDQHIDITWSAMIDAALGIHQ